MVTDTVSTVLKDNSNRRITITEVEKKKTKISEEKKSLKSKPSKAKKNSPETSIKADDSIIGTACPKCGKGLVVKGKTAYGCSEWKSGCSFRLPFI